ncbi:MAG: type III-B CRISPR-associated protein Cas10/Cmr2, partial [Candidatus Eremiobacterota bacterium]
MENKFTALTIGPIYKTLSQTRKTRELWGASFMFSYLMRKIIEGLGNTQNCVLPYHNDMLNLARSKGAGLFPDRLIFKGDVREKIITVSENVIHEIARISELPEEYLKHYFRISTICFEVPLDKPVVYNSDGNKSTDSNVVFIADKLLDSTELHEKYTPSITNLDWKKAIDKLNGKLFYREAFSGKDNSFKFPSIPEISTDDFRKRDKTTYYRIVNEILNRAPNPGESEEENEDKNQKDFLNRLKTEKAFIPLKLRPYHKYIAVVQADGDNIGNTVRKIGKDPETVKQFSSALFEFDLRAVELIKEFGGKAVYIGGDDLLFFAPVAVAIVNSNNENTPKSITYLNTVFSLLRKLDKAFKEKVIESPVLKHLYDKGGELEGNIPSMSYGISITYS